MFPHLVQRSSFRLLVALTLSVSLLLMPAVFWSGSEAAPGQAPRAGKPRREKPEGELPDLEDAQRESLYEREASAPIHSTVRSPKVPLEPWNGRRVGDPDRSPDSERSPDSAKSPAPVLRAHARCRVTASPPPVLDDQFVQNFFTGAVSRAPNASEATYWEAQQTAFNAAFNDLSARLRANGGKNSCAEAFGGVQKAEEALRSKIFSIDRNLRDDVNAFQEVKDIRLNPSPKRALMTPKGSTYNYDLVEVLSVEKLPGGGESLKISSSVLKVSSVTAGSFLLAHELGHILKIYGATDEDGGVIPNAVNNMKIWKACFNEITPIR